MRLPSIKTLKAAFGARCYDIREALADDSLSIDETFLLVCKFIGGHGVDFIPAGHNAKSPAIAYINMGDPYRKTILWRKGRTTIEVGCWGDIVERGNYD